MGGKKRVAVPQQSGRKLVLSPQPPKENQTILLRFDMLDRDGAFAFDLLRPDFDHKEVLDKLIAYSNMTWTEIMRQVHDRAGKSKHHFLSGGRLSREAIERIRVKGLEEYSDSIFSFALQNRLRIIGIRTGVEFHVVWYDPEHQFCPSRR